MTAFKEIQVSGQSNLDGGVKVHGPSVLTGPVSPYIKKGDLAYSNTDTGIPTRLPVGSNGQVLTVAAGLPSWAAAGGGATFSAASGFGFNSFDHLVAGGGLQQIDLLQAVDPDSLYSAGQRSFIVTAGLWLVSMTVDFAPHSGSWNATNKRYSGEIVAVSTTDGLRPTTNGSNWLDSDGTQTENWAFHADATTDGTNAHFFATYVELVNCNSGSAIGMLAQESGGFGGDVDLGTITFNIAKVK